MLSRDLYDSLPRQVSTLLLDAQNKTVSDIARRIRKMNELSATSEYQLNRLAEIDQFDMDFRDALGTAAGLVNETIDKMYEDAATRAYTYDKRLFEAKGIPMSDYSENKWLQQLTTAMADQTKDEFKNITQTKAIGFKTSKGKFLKYKNYFIRQLDTTEFLVSSGAMSYDWAIKKVVREMVSSGLRTVTYSNRSDSIEVATRRAIMTGLGNLDEQISIRNIVDLGVKHVQVSWHSTARTGEGINNHAAWQGGVYALNGFDLTTMTRVKTDNDPDYKDFVETTGYGEVQGLHGANCRHSFSGFDVKSQVPNYTPEELKDKAEKEATEQEFKFSDGTVSNFTPYGATQQMRKMEVAMRKQRALAKGYRSGGNEDAYISAKAKYHSQLHEYNKFAKAMGLQPEMQRVYMDNLRRI